MSVRENFTLQLQLPDRLECPQDYEDVYGAFEREANEYVRKRVRFGEWDDKSARIFVTYWWRGSLGHSRERLAELFRPREEGESADAYIANILATLEGCRDAFRSVRQALGVRDREGPGEWWQGRDRLVSAVHDTVEKLTGLGPSLREFVRSVAESHYPLDSGAERVRRMFDLVARAREVVKYARRDELEKYPMTALRDGLLELDALEVKSGV